MAEYIDIDAQVVVTDTRGKELETTVRHILDMNKGVYTAADVRPVVRGEWIDVRYDDEELVGGWYTIPKCSVCKEEAPYKSNFCPNCGADMREES